MGWERKRGKLEEFNRLLRGAADTSFAARVGDVGRLGEVRYVITLDADTQLPRDAARRLVGAMAHPLNRARFDARRRARRRAATASSSRASASRCGARGRSRFTRIFSGDTGRRPVHDRRLGRLPGPLRRGHLRRQGHLRRRRLRRGAGRAGPGERAPQPRPVRGLLRADGAGDRHRALRRLPVDATWPTPRASTAGCAATGRLLPAGSRPARPPRDLEPLEDVRQPAAQPGGAGGRCCCSAAAGPSCRARRSSGRCFVLLTLVFPVYGLARRRAHASHPRGVRVDEPPARRLGRRCCEPRRRSR